MVPKFSQPSLAEVEQFLVGLVDQPFSYPDVGCTQGEPPRRYTVDRNRILLGRGRQVFSTACAALRRWEMFRLGWVELHAPQSTIAPGAVVAVVVRANALWWFNGARVVYVCEAAADERQFGFAYGTLVEHAEQGEERFSIQRDENDNVWYEIVAASRPGHWYGWVGYPLVRRLQRRFAADSLQAMVRAVRNSGK